MPDSRTGRIICKEGLSRGALPDHDHTPVDGEIREATRGLTNGRAGGASGMRAEDVKGWLHGIKLEEDPETGPNNQNVGDNWRLFIWLIETIWDHGNTLSFSG
jgi:hypothetical protein